MIEIQLKIDGPWIPLVRAKTGMDLTISEGERILRSGVMGVRITLPDSPVASMTVRRYGKRGQYGFMWQSASMAAPAFENFDPPE